MSVFSYLQGQVQGAKSAVANTVSNTYHAAVKNIGPYISATPKAAAFAISGQASAPGAKYNVPSTGDYIKSTLAPVQGLTNTARDVGALGYGAIGAVTPGHSFKGNIEQYNNVIPHASFSDAGFKGLEDQGIISSKIGGVINQAGNIAGGMALPLPGAGAIGAIDALASPAARLAAYTAVRSGEGALYGGLFGAAAHGSGKEALQGAKQGALIGAAGNVLLSPRLAVKAGVETAEGASAYARNVADQQNIAKVIPKLGAGYEEIVPSTLPSRTRNPDGSFTNAPTVHINTMGQRDMVPRDVEIKKLSEPVFDQAIRSGKDLGNVIDAGKNLNYNGRQVEIHIDRNTGDVLSIRPENPAYTDYLKKSADLQPASAPKENPYLQYANKQAQPFEGNPAELSTAGAQARHGEVEALKPGATSYEQTLSETASRSQKAEAPFVDTTDEQVQRALGETAIGHGINALPDQVKNNFQSWVNATRHDTLSLEGQKVQQDFAHLPEHAQSLEGPNTPPEHQISRFQANAPASPEEAAGFAQLREFFNNKYQQLTDAGVPVQYQKDYLNQIWKGSEAEQGAVVDRYLKLNPSLSKEKVFSNYAEGIAAGLVPKTTNLSELSSLYEQQANRAIADTTFFKEGLKSGMLQPEPQPGFEQVKNFPGERLSYEKNGQMVEHSGSIYAPAPLAEVINNQMSQAKILNDWVNVSTNLKNIVLSGGVPGTAWNFHGFTTIGRDVLASSNPVKMLRNAVIDVANMTAPGLAREQVAQNIDRAIELSHSGLTLSTEAPAFTSAVEKPSLGTRAFEGYKKVMEDPLFKGMLPATKLRYADELAQSLEKKGLSRQEANKIASENANTLFGGNNLAELGKNKDTQQVMRAIFLAPDTIASSAGTAKGVLGAILNPTNPKYWAFRAVAINTAGAYVLMNLENKRATGHYMYQNAPGHTFELQEGNDDSGNIRYIRPFGQATDFIKLPLDAATAIAKGDLNQVARIITNRINPIASQITQIATNTTPFGQPITRPGDTTPQKLEKYGANVLSGVVPAGVGSAARYATGQTTPEQAISSALELPVRYGTGASTQDQRALVSLLKDQGKSGTEIGQALEGYKKDTAINPNNAASSKVKADLTQVNATQSAQKYIDQQQAAVGNYGAVSYANRASLAKAFPIDKTSGLTPEQKAVVGLSQADREALLQRDPSLAGLLNDPAVLNASAPTLKTGTATGVKGLGSPKGVTFNSAIKTKKVRIKAPKVTVGHISKPKSFKSLTVKNVGGKQPKLSAPRKVTRTSRSTFGRTPSYRSLRRPRA